MSIFIKKGSFCIIPRDPAEVYERYMYRGYAIISNNPSNKERYNLMEKLSRYSSNIKYLSCVYSKTIHEQCKEIDENIK